MFCQSLITVQYTYPYSFFAADHNVIPDDFETMYEKIKKLVVKKPRELQNLGYPLLESDYQHQGNFYPNGVYIQYTRAPQARTNIELQTWRRQQQELDIQKYQSAGSIKHYCERCTFPFLVHPVSGDYLIKEKCRYHWGKVLDNRTCFEATWTCCDSSGYSSGCTVAEKHVWSGLEPGDNGPYFDFVQTQPSSFCSVYALDCEMVLTKWGRELAKVTIVDMDGEIIYDTLVKPKTEVIDYVTRFTGIRQEDLDNVSVTLEQVQKDILSFVSAETILIGHALANDLRALKIVHYNVVDTSAIFPHYMGLPYQNGLKMLAKRYLGMRIQEGEHKPAEDAVIAARLVKSKLKSIH